ncbi:MAG: fused MFS/spermidine synthase [Gammaproteobacteria bacterium]|nr:fused MFS/spermidine synthase [Gammaproteobacteria bacterium]
MIQLVYTGTLVLSAALLFTIQPMFASMVLPSLGGSPAVWNTSMVFYQAVLLAGYAYAHFSTRLLDVRRQSILHLFLLVSAFIVLPIAVATNWSPPTDTTPVLWLIALLTVSIGLPFFALSATAPLLQKWFAHTHHTYASNPYFLYAASNLGSILALLAYPILLDPFLGLIDQSTTWTFGYGGLVILMVACVFLLWRNFAADILADHHPAAEELTSEVDWKLRTQWMMLSFVPSSLLLGVTTHITTDIASVPLLWVIPLALYLLTFIIVFSRRTVIPHRWVVSVHAYLVLIFVIALYVSVLSIWVTLLINFLMFFVSAMLCHGELAKRRPAAKHLTEFYLWMSFGGVLGGCFNALLAPLLFNSALEYPLAIVMACALRPVLSEGRNGRWALDLILPALLGVVLLAVFTVTPDILELIQAATPAVIMFCTIIGMVVFGFSPRPVRFALGIAVLFVAIHHLASSEHTTLLTARNFFGVHTVSRDESRQFTILKHGTTMHGAQSTNPQKWREPLTYYVHEGPTGQVFTALHSDPGELSIAVVGLGTGAIACYRRPEDNLTFYEIDASILEVAQDDRYFHYLDECAPDARIVLGDARLALVREPDRKFDILIIDAFSSDSIPIHLLTREAIDLYFRKLENDGLLLVHISNQYLDLEPVLANLSQQAQLAARIQFFSPKKLSPTTGLGVEEATTEAHLGDFHNASLWVLLAANEQALGRIATDRRWRLLEPDPAVGLWTDDYSNITKVLRWKMTKTSD